eukprot:NODE_3987_length_829_cov_42.591168_g3964_i0.p2 GENE.NODE_3987_length_829_cov_42.591168_g3964_i0~~NODE_3987_length_829_cov_42.591168_g3964_i0.p2  ORF type:complete len:249 (-),score=96.97 NODE_3987_length_829_cov_42.591168_g3964_i0:81-794(-)
MSVLPQQQAAAVDDDSSDSDVEQLQYKVVILGDGAVGKTSITMRFCKDYFAAKYKQTIGLDFFTQQLQLPDNVHVSFQILDIGGQTIGSKMIGNYVFGAQAILLVYDITNYQSFLNLEEWIAVVKRSTPQFESSPPLLYLVGNKMDLKHLRTVKADKHNAWAESNHMYSAFVSAKNGDGINSTFTRLGADLAGVVLTKNEVAASNTIVTAEIVDHQQNDPAQKPLQIKEKKGKCLVM